MYSKSGYHFCFILLLFLVHLLTVEAMSMAPLRRSRIVPSLHSSSVKLWEMKDPRPDGITYERSNVLLLQHLQKTAPTKSLADFSNHGLQRVYIDSSDAQSIERSEIFLEYLISNKKSKGSIWEVEIMEGSGWGNWTLLSAFIEELPAISTLKWATSFPIPAMVLKTLELNHPTCRLFYELSSHTLDTTGSTILDDDDGYLYRRTEMDDPHLQKDIRAREIESIVNSTALYSVSADFDGLGSPTPEIDLIHRILTTCPNVRELDLRVGHQRCRGCKPPRAFNFKPPRAFNFSDTSKRLPALEVSRLKGFDF